ncbi:MAG: hypothetical protein HOV79_16285 [Hamadaea sp.]|nr:hypothetical protein [Hamadaea sp.]
MGRTGVLVVVTGLVLLIVGLLRPADERFDWPWLLLPIGGAVALVIGVVVLVLARRHWRVRRHGTPATATVLEATDTGAAMNNTPVLKLRLLVAAPGQAPFETSVRAAVSPTRLMHIQRTGVPVKIDPKDPRRIVVEWR